MSYMAKPIVDTLKADKRLRREGYVYHFIESIVKEFPNGEICVEIPESVRSMKVYLLHSPALPDPNTGIIELILTVDAIERAWADQLIVLATLLPYFRQDRREKKKDGPPKRVPISAKVIAKILNMYPIVRGTITLDFHVEQAPAFFDRATDDLDGRLIFVKHLRKIFRNDFSNVVVSSTDIGGGKRAQRTSHSLMTPLGTIMKGRKDNSKVENIGYIGDDVRGRDVILVDDILDTCNTIVSATQTLLSRGAKSVMAVGTHGLFSIDKKGSSAEDKLRDCGAKVVILDTIPRSEAYLKANASWLTVLPITDFLTQVICESHRPGGSVSSIT
jgi:ribose-phosphate pyrophosphokinase